jgi:triacylglycerol lipase
VHRGFDKELESAYSNVVELISKHKVGQIPVYLTGHSAGGALATLAARRLVENSKPVNAVYVYSPPRVGDRMFSKSYPIPLFRFERNDDVVPHVPLPPSIAKIVGAVFLIDRITEMFPALGGYASGNVEYIHAGELFFADWSDDLVYSSTLGGYFDKLIKVAARALSCRTKLPARNITP